MSTPGVLNGVHRGPASVPGPALADGGPGAAPDGAAPRAGRREAAPLPDGPREAAGDGTRSRRTWTSRTGCSWASPRARRPTC